MNRSNTKPTVSQVVFNYIISLAACISSFQDGSKTTWNHNFWWLIKLVSTSTFGSQKKSHQESRPSASTARLHGIAAVEPSPFSAAVLAHGPVSSWSHSLIHHLSFHGVIQKEMYRKPLSLPWNFMKYQSFPQPLPSSGTFWEAWCLDSNLQETVVSLSKYVGSSGGWIALIHCDSCRVDAETAPVCISRSS